MYTVQLGQKELYIVMRAFSNDVSHVLVRWNAFIQELFSHSMRR